MNFFSCCHFESEAFSRSPRQPGIKKAVSYVLKFSNWSQMEIHQIKYHFCMSVGI